METTMWMITTFPTKTFYMNLPNISYGGEAAMIKRDYGSLTMTRDDVKLLKTCSCDKRAHDNIWVEMKTKQLSFATGAVYRHHSGSVEHFVNDMEATFRKKMPPNQTCFFVSDTNIGLMKYDNNMSFDYLTSLSSNNFIPYISPQLG